jgi:hypothetical protein
MPDFVFFETDLEDITRAAAVYKEYCRFDPITESIYLKNSNIHPDQRKVNLLYPRYLSAAICSFTEYFVEVKLSNKISPPDLYYYEWKLEKINQEKIA